MKTLPEESMAFIAEAFGPDSVRLEGRRPLPSGLSLQTQTTVEAYGFRFFGAPATLLVVAGAPKGQQILALAEKLKELPAPLVFAFHATDKELPGLLVTRDIAHIIPGQKLFAPSLGLLYKSAPKRQERWRTRNAAQLSATGRQVVSCALLKGTEPWQQHWKPMELRLLLQKHLPGASLSPASHTRLLAELVDLGFGESEGGGPQKRFAFVEREELWQRLLLVETETVLRRSRLAEIPPNPIYAGNQALSRLGHLRLNEDETIELAMSQKDFDSLPSIDGRTLTPRILVQVWRNAPALLAEKNGERCLNVIDLALTKRHSPDAREREVLYELLQENNLSPALLMEAS